MRIQAVQKLFHITLNSLISPMCKLYIALWKGVRKISKVSLVVIDRHFSSHLERAGKRSPQRQSCVFPLNSKEETTFQLRIPNISCHLTFSLQGPPGSIYPSAYWHSLQVTDHRTDWGFLNQAVVLCERCLCSRRPLRPELQLTHSNRGQAGILLCLSLLVSKTRQFHNDPSNL